MTSTDGITWTRSTTSADIAIEFWYSVTYGNGLFVAVGQLADSNTIMTSPDGLTWTLRGSLTTSDSWSSVIYAGGKFVAVGLSGVMTSPDGITWTSRSSAADNSWTSVTYGNGQFVAVSSTGSGNRVMTSSSVTATPSNNQISLAFTAPTDTDLASTTILRSTSAITDTPTEGVYYATSSTIGASTVVCSVAITASTTATCNATGLTNGTPYYFKLFTSDTSGNYSEGVSVGPVAPGSTTVTLGYGTDTPSTSVAPGGSATTSDTFTFQTTSGTDVIQSVTATFATGTAAALSLVEITNDAGSTVYGSVANPSSDIVPITLSTNTLTANTTLTQYRIRITPKTHTNMPAPPGSSYNVSSYISSFQGTSAATAGDDLSPAWATTTVIAIDNESPSDPSSVSGYVTDDRNVLITYNNPSTSDASSVIVVRSTNSSVDSPAEGATYSPEDVLGSSKVICVSSSIILSASSVCVDSTPTRLVRYYYELFTKDSSGNYSAGIVPTGDSFVVRSAAPIVFQEAETSNGATTTVSGGGQGGNNDNSSSTNATTTQGGGGQGGGGGDSGNLYKPSNLAGMFKKMFGFLATQAVRNQGTPVLAESPVPLSTASTSKGCQLKLFGVCIVGGK
jgi:hypothetical protein